MVMQMAGGRFDALELYSASYLGDFDGGTAGAFLRCTARCARPESGHAGPTVHIDGLNLFTGQPSSTADDPADDEAKDTRIPDAGQREVAESAECGVPCDHATDDAALGSLGGRDRT